MEKLKVLLGLCIAGLIFLTGFLACYGMNYVYIDKESPYLIGLGSLNNQPSDYITRDNIQIYKDKIVINVANAGISQYADTGSMLPTLGENANGIEVTPESPDQINIGDIITYQSGSNLIVHRVVDKGKDENGDWFVTKGDNNPGTDSKIYFNQVKYLTIALIY